MYLAGHEHTLELHTDACKDVPEAQGRPPLPQVVSGAAGKQRPLNTAFARHQLAANPRAHERLDARPGLGLRACDTRARCRPQSG